ncbi:MAG: GNAT family N-acetyltransferase [Gemmatimonadaceae bacterium]
MSPLGARARRAVDEYWAEFLGRARDELRPGRAVVVAHAAQLEDYLGVYALELGGAPIVSAPPALAPALRARLAGLGPGALREPGSLLAALGDAARAVVGPAWIGYVDDLDAEAGDDGDVRALDERDERLVDQLRAACAHEEWEHGGSELTDGAAMGAFVGETLVALAGYEVWGGRLAHIAVVAHPDHRGAGHATRVVRAAARRALEAGLVPQYRTLAANGASLAVARRVGFAWYATSLAVRLSSASD